MAEEFFKELYSEKKCEPNQLAFGANGITKFEFFAGLALQGVMANSEFKYNNHTAIVEEAIKLTDELIKQLDKKK